MESSARTPAAEITAAVTGIWAAEFGKGPDRARTYFNDEHVIVVMYGGLLSHEQVLLEAGEGDLVRTVRQRFEQILAPRLTRAVEQATGRRVLTYESQIVYDPTRTFELFVLDQG
jgi:uncharacterized protein YbcI